MNIRKIRLSRYLCCLWLCQVSIHTFKTTAAFQINNHNLAERKVESLLFYTHGSDTEEESWALELDWTLIDQVPHFTVGTDTQKRTFWTQLSAATLVLAEKDPLDLYNRCQQLIQEGETSSLNDENGNLAFGPSPPLLQNWYIEDMVPQNNKLVGQTENGRTIWVQYHCIGRLEGDPMADIALRNPGMSSWLPGGYLEAVGGRIYELGQPHPNTRATVVSSNHHIEEKSHSSFNLWGDDEPELNQKSDNENPVSVWKTASTATMSALLASTILSACIGYGSGMAIVSDSASPSYRTAQVVMTPRMAPTGPSISEKRAKAEYKVLREERILREVSQKLEMDRIELQELRQSDMQ